MSNKYILINLNQGESKEARQERVKEQSRWIIFGIIILVFVLLNGGVLLINQGYNNVIKKKKSEIASVNKQLAELRSQGKNISKNDIQSLASIEGDRFMWASIMEELGNLTPEDIAITGLAYKFGKWTISGIATIYEDMKDFDIINNYVNGLRNSHELSKNFSRIKFTEYSRSIFRGQELIMFTVVADLNASPKEEKAK